MCGLAGIWSLAASGDAAALAARCASMTAALQHRGPDDGAVWTDPSAGLVLGHRRLAILDLSPAGAQPMVSRDGRFVLVFNGEIYNFSSLRAELETLGVVFRGHADTEVLLEACGLWGLGTTLERLNGMFAFALWDRLERRLHLARDRMGEKPLYYGWSGSRLLFASELKALHAAGDFQPTVDRDALTLYLRHGYVPEPHSIYQGIRKLPPGTSLTLTDPTPGVLPAPRPYWALSSTIIDAHQQGFAGDAAAGVDALESTLKQAVELRMVADVPLGAFLSGGIDSSLIVALMQAASRRPVKTFTIGFDVPDYDEAPHARAVARHLGTEHTELYVRPEDALSVIPRLPTMYDEPFADCSQIPTHLVSALARQQVTVAMSGDAGDELFAGYSRYAVANGLWQRQRRWPLALRRATAAGLRAVSPATWDRVFNLLHPLLPRAARQPMPGDKLHKLSRLLAEDDPLAMYFKLISLWQTPAEAVPGAQEPASALALAAAAPAGLNTIERMMFVDSLHYLPGDILAKVDRASMACSLEARVPFLDPAVVALAWRLPFDWKLRGGVGKWVLRELLARYVPRPLFERPKRGFAVPIDQWLRGPLRDWAEHLLAERRLAEAGFFAPAMVRAVWRAHLAGGQNLQYMLWHVLMFEAWRERWHP